jgi:hypothetical protein
VERFPGLAREPRRRRRRRAPLAAAR